MAEHPVIVTFGPFELDGDRRRVDRDEVWRFLSTEAVLSSVARAGRR
jgi:hypothetical protein